MAGGGEDKDQAPVLHSLVAFASPNESAAGKTIRLQTYKYAAPPFAPVPLLLTLQLVSRGVSDSPGR